MPMKDWTVVGRAVRHDQCGVTVRFEGFGGSYSGHHPTFAYKQMENGLYYVPPLTLANRMNPYHTKNWEQLVQLVDEARGFFEGKL